jgi:hypothetical protein
MKSAGSHTALFYFAGWLFGGCAIGIAMYLDAVVFGDPRYAVALIPGVFLYSRIALFFGGPFLLLGTYLLRRLTGLFGAPSPLLWAAVGAALGPFLLFALLAILFGLRGPMPGAGYGLSPFQPGSIFTSIRSRPTIPAGAATSFALYYFERARRSQIQTTA